MEGLEHGTVVGRAAGGRDLVLSPYYTRWKNFSCPSLRMENVMKITVPRSPPCLHHPIQPLHLFGLASRGISTWRLYNLCDDRLMGSENVRSEKT